MSGATIQQQAVAELRERSNPSGPYPYLHPYFPTLRYLPVSGGYDARPEPWQVLDEGEPRWLRSAAEFQREYYRTCGPIAVAHAVNFTRAAKNGGDSFYSWNVADSIDVCEKVGAYTRGDQTTTTYKLRNAIQAGTGLVDLQTGSYGDLTYSEAYETALTRWIVVNTPGHISLVIADPDAGDLRLVQYKVSAGPLPGKFDANDLHIQRGEWPGWSQFLCWPDKPLWSAPGETSGLLAQFFAERKAIP